MITFQLWTVRLRDQKHQNWCNFQYQYLHEARERGSPAADLGDFPDFRQCYDSWLQTNRLKNKIWKNFFSETQSYDFLHPRQCNRSCSPYTPRRRSKSDSFWISTSNHRQILGQGHEIQLWRQRNRHRFLSIRVPKVNLKLGIACTKTTGRHKKFKYR